MLIPIIIIIFQQISSKPELKFNANNEFTILQFTDLHYGYSFIENSRTNAIQIKLIENIRPDLVIITGDLVSGYLCRNQCPGLFENNWLQFSKIYTKLKQPYALIFGNHDLDAELTAEQIANLEFSNNFSIFNGSRKIDPFSFSNYKVSINSNFSNQTEFNLWMFDTRSMNCQGNEFSYGCIGDQQLKWFAQESEISRSDNQYISGLVFFHIPLPEFMQLWNIYETGGVKGESVSCPLANSGAFEEFKKRGNVKGVYCGHDHNNDFQGTYKGVQFAYGRKTGFGSYMSRDLQKGGRVIKIKGKRESGRLLFEINSFIVQEDLTIVTQRNKTFQTIFGTSFQGRCLEKSWKVLVRFYLLIFLIFLEI